MCGKELQFPQHRGRVSCLRVEPAEAGGGLGAKRTHLTVFAA